MNLDGIPFIFHFELPDQKETYLNRVIKRTDDDVIAITFTTDLELPQVRKIEQSIGKKIEVADLPEDLLIEEVSKASLQKAKILKEQEEEAHHDTAFHKRKESNSKTTNFGIGQKAIMNKKKKH